MSVKQSIDERWEAQVQAAVRQFRYPATPDVARAVRSRITDRRQPGALIDPSRRLAWALVAALILAVGLLAVPDVRAALRSFLRIGAVEFVQPTPAFPPPSPPAPEALLDLAGETTLDEARANIAFPLRLPTYPSDLGQPDRVYTQDLGGPAVVLAWIDPTQPDEVWLSLQMLSNEAWAYKIVDQRLVEETTVNGVRAAWVSGPHILQFRDRNGRTEPGPRRLVDGHVLIWQDGDLTYRLETDLSLEEAVRIAESLQ